MESHEIVLLKEHGIVTNKEARKLLGFEDSDDLGDRVRRARIELQAAYDSKGGAIEWRTGIARALEILATETT